MYMFQDYTYAIFIKLFDFLVEKYLTILYYFLIRIIEIEKKLVFIPKLISLTEKK